MFTGKTVVKNKKVSKFRKNNFEFDAKKEQADKGINKHQDKALRRALKNDQMAAYGRVFEEFGGSDY